MKHETKVDGAVSDQHAPTGNTDAVVPVTGEGNDTGGNDTPPVELPTGDAPQAGEGATPDLPGEGEGDEGEGNEGQGATLEPDLNDPVLLAAKAAMVAGDKPQPGDKPSTPVSVSAAAKPAVTLLPPTKAQGEKNKAFQKRLAAWRKQHPDYVPPAKQATPATPVATGKGEADKPSTPAPATPPAPSPVSAVTPAKGKAGVKAALVANPANCEGYDFSHMPPWLPFVPSREAIMAVTALGVKSPLSKNHLGMAFALEQAAPQNRSIDRLVNVYDVGAAMVCVDLFAHTKPDHKINTCTDHERQGYVIPLPGVPSVVTRRPLPPGVSAPKAQTVKAYTLTSAGLKKVSEYFKARGETVPLWLSDPHAACEAYQADQAALAVAADKAAKKAAREASKANA